MYHLTSNIPGVKVTLTPNPLNALIELTDSARRELALMIVMNEMLDDVYSAHFDLQEQRNLQDIKEGKDAVTRPYFDVERAKNVLKYIVDRWFGKDEDGDGWEGNLASPDRWLQDKRVMMWLDEINTEHSGDCTAFACSCTRCHMEDILGINTLPGGNMINHRLRNYWWDEFATPEQKEEKRIREEEFKKKYPSQWIPDEATKERWNREDIDAKAAWAEHKQLLLQQQSNKL